MLYLSEFNSLTVIILISRLFTCNVLYLMRVHNYVTGQLTLSVFYMKQISFSFDVGRQSLESKVVEETSYFVDAIREHKGEALSLSVSKSI